VSCDKHCGAGDNLGRSRKGITFFRGNKLLELVVEALPTDPPEEYEVIVDYKGMKRPEASGKGKSLWEIYKWQVHTCGRC
jgi:hypothetical protein